MVKNKNTIPQKDLKITITYEKLIEGRVKKNRKMSEEEEEERRSTVVLDDRIKRTS